MGRPPHRGSSIENRGRALEIIEAVKTKKATEPVPGHSEEEKEKTP